MLEVYGHVAHIKGALLMLWQIRYIHSWLVKDYLYDRSGVSRGPEMKLIIIRRPQQKETIGRYDKIKACRIFRLVFKSRYVLGSRGINAGFF